MIYINAKLDYRLNRITVVMLIAAEEELTKEKVDKLLAPLSKGVTSLFSYLHSIGQMNKVNNDYTIIQYNVIFYNIIY